jgi:hypothetical protein
MSVITVRRTLRKPPVDRRYLLLRSFREVTRGYFAKEKFWEFIIEVLLFAVVAAVSAWPIFAAADALNKFLQHGGS